MLISHDRSSRRMSFTLPVFRCGTPLSDAYEGCALVLSNSNGPGTLYDHRCHDSAVLCKNPVTFLRRTWQILRDITELPVILTLAGPLTITCLLSRCIVLQRYVGNWSLNSKLWMSSSPEGSWWNLPSGKWWWAWYKRCSWDSLVVMPSTRVNYCLKTARRLRLTTYCRQTNNSWIQEEVECYDIFW